MFGLVEELRTDGDKVEGGSDDKLCLGEKGKGSIWKYGMGRVLTDWDHDVEGDAEGPV